MPTLTRILLIDDDAVDRQSVRRALAASDLIFNVTEAVDGKSGLEAARGDPFDCVLLDFRLPDADAFDLIGQLQSPDGGRQTVIILTGEKNPETALALMRAGALDYLSKDELDPHTLARAIRYAKARHAFVGELEAARREAEEKSEALDALNRQKSLLFSIIAHDLRNPFQVLLGLSETIERAIAAEDAAAVRRRVRGLRDAAEQAHALMEGLFGWAKLQMDTAEVVRQPLELDPIVTEAIAPCIQSAEDKGVAIVVEGVGVRLVSQRDMLTAILRNLISNAVKFTPPGGRVTVKASQAPLRIEVTDTGVGMAPQTLADLFRADRRTTSPGTAGERGSGLGLLLCHDLAKRLDGELTVRSTVGQGSTFSLALPS